MLETVDTVREKEDNFNKLGFIWYASKTVFVYVKTAVVAGIKKIKFNRININKKDGLCTSIKAGM